MLPNLIVIGAQKCGTSALHYYLRHHPDISMSRPKELNFFIENRNWTQGPEWYARHFSDETPVAGESSPNYTAHPHFAGVPERMHSLVPDAKLIFIVRDPLARMISQYVHNYTKRAEHRDLATTLRDPNKTYVSRSKYQFQIDQFLPYYPRSSILVLEQGDLLERRLETLDRIFGFLGVDPYESKKYSKLKHQTSEKERKTRLGAWSERALPARVWGPLSRRLPVSTPVERPVMSDDLREEMVAALKDDIDRFREFAGRGFESWSV